MNPSKSAPHLSFRMKLANFDIGSIRTRHETSAELSNSAKDHVSESRCSHPGVRECSPRQDVKQSKSAPYMGLSFSVAGFDIGSIEAHHEMSAELSSSSGDDDVAARSIIPVPERFPGEDMKPSKSAPHMVERL